MAVTSVSKTEYTAGKSEQGDTRTELYRVVFDAVPSDIADALTASAGGTTIPVIGAVFSGSTTIKCKKIGPVRKTDSRLIVDVQVEYDNVYSGGGGVIVTTNPLDRPADIQFGFDVIERVKENDINGKPIVNAAMDKFDPPIVVEVYRMVVSIERNVSATTFDPGSVLNLMNTTNSSAGTLAGVSIGVGQALLKNYGASIAYESDTTYVRERLDIVLADTHAVKVANMGMYYLDTFAAGNRLRFLDSEGTSTTTPRWLSATGTAGDNTPTTAGSYLTFDIYEQKSWTPLGLPSGFP